MSALKTKPLARNKIMYTILLIFTFFLVRGQDIQRPSQSKQEPSAPFSYLSEDITFANAAAGITLAGTLTFPKELGEFPAVILISGNGKHNRDEEFSGHKPFLVIADYLTKNGYVVLRFDKRGVGLSSGDYEPATTIDFSSDVKAAIHYLRTRKEVDEKKIGLIGHSEGGLIAPMVASESKDVAFIVLLAGPGLPGDELLLLQQTSIAQAKGAGELEIQKSKDLNQKAFKIVKKYTAPEELKIKMTQYITEISKDDPDKPETMSEQAYIDLQVTKILSPWMVNFLRYDPSPALEKVRCPVFVLSGTKDLQVSPLENIAALKRSLEKGGNKKVTTMLLPDLNHLFQESKTGLPEEYDQIEQSFSPIALTAMVNWLNKQVN